MIYTHEVQQMCCVKKGANHPCAPIPEEGKWVRSKEIKDISGLTHGIGWCAPQQGACKLTLNVKEGIIQEASSRAAHHRPRLRRYQHCYARTVPANRLRPHSVGFL